MAFMLGFILATVGVACCILAGLVLLAIPKLRQLAPYAFLVYPAAYVGGLVVFVVVGLLGNLIEEPDSTPLLWAMVLVIFGAGALGALAGAFTGMAIANRLWWLFFSSAEEKAARSNLGGWLATPPFAQRIWDKSVNFLRTARHSEGPATMHPS